MSEAQSIAIQLEKLQTQRPLTHDLIKTLADTLKTTLKEVYIYRLSAGIFYSELLFETDMNIIKIDSRTSDAIALALRYDCPVYTTPEIITKAGIVVAHDASQMLKGEVMPSEAVEVEEIRREYSVSELNKMLDEAVKNEEYEKASKIRDMLKEKSK